MKAVILEETRRIAVREVRDTEMTDLHFWSVRAQ
jgi:hypothetical protein